MIVRARTVLPMTGDPPIDNGAVVVKGGRIRAVGRLPDVAAMFTGDIRDLGEQVLMPGLINAHCHLDYSMLRRAIQPPKGFSAWVQRLNALKRSFEDADYLEAIQKGFEELLKWGTTTVLNIESFPELMSRLPIPPIRTWWFYEMIDVRQRITTENLLEGAGIFFRQHADWHGGFGLSPHAPYTASVDLYRLASDCAHQQPGMVLTTHIAESAEESAMFREARGPLYDFLKSIGRDMSDCGHGSPFRRLVQCGAIGPDWIVAHMNELDDGDFALLERTPVHVVHCPASHRYFGHTPFPIDRLRALGINICLGTDSLASNDALNMFAEMRLVCERHHTVSPLEALKMATVNPARALGRAGALGRIAHDAQADLIALPVNAGEHNLYEEIVWHRRPVEWAMVNGEIAHI